MRYRRWFEILLALDCLIGSCLGAWSDETMSAYAYRKQLAGEARGRRWVSFIDALFFWQEQHCAQAYAHDQARRLTPPAQRQKLS
jgi:hypothetical protein